MNAQPPQAVASSSNTRRTNVNAAIMAGDVPQHQQLPVQSASTSSSSSNNVFSFSVHQPYSSWPLHRSLPTTNVTPYATTWYPLPTTYSQPQTYKENWSQTPSLEVLLDYEQRKGALVNPVVRQELNQPQTPPKFRRHWDAVFARFLDNAGLRQTKKGFEADMIVMNEEWEKDNVLFELDKLVKDLTAKDPDDAELPPRPLEDRKVDYMRASNGVEAQTPTTVTRSISRFIAESRKRNDASNRAEFLLSLAEKKRRLNESTDAVDPSSSSVAPSPEVPLSSCARTDAKPLNRDIQMKYDIAKNEDGPLKRTMKINMQQPGMNNSSMALNGTTNNKGKVTASNLPGNEDDKDIVTAERHPGLAERFANIESHLAVRYVPSVPHSLLDRIKFLEDHLTKLEKCNPSWAALHFNQPNRGWPPPPRPTPIIVPSHLTSSSYDELPSDPSAALSFSPFSVSSLPPSYAYTSSSGSQPAAPSSLTQAASQGKRGRGGKPRPGHSSLHRAVLERLEVKKAMDDLAGRESTI